MRQIYISILTCLFAISAIGQTTENPLLTSDKAGQQKWVDSLYNNMTLKEKVGQLYMMQVMSNQDEATKNSVIKTITEHHIGGVIYSNGGPNRQAKLNNELQALSKIPMLIGMDAEWGLSMRLDSTYAFPWNMTLGAIKDNKLVEQAGRQIGEHCKRLGVHFNFAPVVDINTNPKNPIIGNRSFGEDRDNVTKKALAFMKGMQDAGVLANAKHFPGHGDTDQDSHLTLPTVSFNEKRIDSIELYPYKKLIKEGLSSAMVAHLNVPSLEAREGYPSSLSKHIVTDILKERLGFKGLIFTDALTMKGAANFSETGDIDLAAFKAGNDVMLMSEDVGVGVSKIIEAYHTGDITEERLAHSVKKILQAKYKVGLNNYEPIGLYNLSKDLNRLKDDILYEDLLENAITVVKSENDMLPLKRLETKTIAYVKLGDDSGSAFLDELRKYAKVHAITSDNLFTLINKLKPYNTVVIGFHRSNDNPWESYKLSNKDLVWLHEIAQKVAFDDVYDVASLTKILATLPLLMELEEQGIVSLDTKLSAILPEYKSSNKAHVTLKSMLSHYARLRPWEPFYYHTLDSVTKRPSKKYYRNIRSDKFNIEVSKNLFLRTDYQDSIPKIIKDSELLERKRYRYSDFPYYILKKFIEQHYDRTLDQLVQSHFYESMGASNTLYNPYYKLSSKKIVPTEIDDYYRHQKVHGYVHDMGAAMQNGVGGHAGVFSNANDVAKIMQMYLQKGYYGGKRYLKPETIDKFNTCYYCDDNNRRGIGFDKPQLGDSGPTCGCISMTSFGHSGFTGTYAWADPAEEIVYVFLANRTYPHAGKNLLLRENIRTEIQRLIYEAIED